MEGLFKKNILIPFLPKWGGGGLLPLHPISDGPEIRCRRSKLQLVLFTIRRTLRNLDLCLGTDMSKKMNFALLHGVLLMLVFSIK